MLRVMLVDEDAERSQILQEALQQAGYEVVARLGSGSDLAAQVGETQPDVIIIDMDSPDRDILEHLCSISRDQPRPVVMFTHDDDSTKMRAALRAGVSAYVVRGLESERVKPIVEVAMARFQEVQALRKELGEMKTALADRKLVERAKGIVMKQRSCTEEQAYALMRKLAMDRNQRIADVAENIIDMAKLLT